MLPSFEDDHLSNSFIDKDANFFGRTHDINRGTAGGDNHLFLPDEFSDNRDKLSMVMSSGDQNHDVSAPTPTFPFGDTVSKDQLANPLDQLYRFSESAKDLPDFSDGGVVLSELNEEARDLPEFSDGSVGLPEFDDDEGMPETADPALLQLTPEVSHTISLEAGESIRKKCPPAKIPDNVANTKSKF